MPSTSTAHEVDRNVSAAADVKPKSRWRSRKQVSIDMSAKFFYRRLPMHYSSFFNTKLYGSIPTGTSLEGWGVKCRWGMRTTAILTYSSCRSAESHYCATATGAECSGETNSTSCSARSRDCSTPPSPLATCSIPDYL